MSTEAQLRSLLATLIGFDTRNPGGDEMKLARWLHDFLATHHPDALTLKQVPRPTGNPSAYVFARWGVPRTLINVHIDTVPDVPGWSHPPLEMRDAGDHLSGLGTADTKGALAAVLCAIAQKKPQDVVVLFSGDEEKSSVAMHAFVKSSEAQGIATAVVCEPTGCRLGRNHRGMVALEATATGPGGHSSQADIIAAPVAALARAATALADFGAEACNGGTAEFPGLCVNIAHLSGGSEFNIIPSYAKLIASARPPPLVNAQGVYDHMARLVQAAAPKAQVRAALVQPAFACRDFAHIQSRMGMPEDAGCNLGFWTEAALLDHIGINAVVFGPGEIEQAHAANEKVPMAHLLQATRTFARSM